MPGIFLNETLMENRQEGLQQDKNPLCNGGMGWINRLSKIMSPPKRIGRINRQFFIIQGSEANSSSKSEWRDNPSRLSRIHSPHKSPPASHWEGEFPPSRFFSITAFSPGLRAGTVALPNLSLITEDGGDNALSITSLPCIASE
jgi:hypothetical protein